VGCAEHVVDTDVGLEKGNGIDWGILVNDNDVLTMMMCLSMGKVKETRLGVT
jgi:hypothetical protein